jgi:hypothetical protein
MEMVRLRASQGTDECNLRASYRVDNDGTVIVPAEAVGPLLAVGGFTLADPPPTAPLPGGNVRMRHRSDPTASLTHKGVEYAPDESGVVTVPNELLSLFRALGFEDVTRSPAGEEPCP